MYCDNKSAIQIAHNSVFHKRTKHVEIDYHFTCYHFKHDTITLSFVSSSLQLVDFFNQVAFYFPFSFSSWQTLDAYNSCIVNLRGMLRNKRVIL